MQGVIVRLIFSRIYSVRCITCLLYILLQYRVVSYLVKGTVIDGNTLKLLGHPTPFLAHELNTDMTISKVKILANTFNLFLRIFVLFNLLSNENECKYITIS